MLPLTAARKRKQNDNEHVNHKHSRMQESTLFAQPNLSKIDQAPPTLAPLMLLRAVSLPRAIAMGLAHHDRCSGICDRRFLTSMNFIGF